MLNFRLTVIFLSSLLIASCGNNDYIIKNLDSDYYVHEGLPHHSWENELFESELRKSNSQKIKGFPFYEPSVKMSQSEKEKFISLLTNSNFPEKYKEDTGGIKLCGGFHPDYSVSYTSEGETIYYHICYGCLEMRVYSSGTYYTYDGLYESFNSIMEFFKKYRKNRPLSEHFEG